MPDLWSNVRAVAGATGFSGAVRVDEPGLPPRAGFFGLANRAAGTPVTARTRFGIASGTKGFTALVVMRLVEDGLLSLNTTARSLLGSDLPSIDDTVTIEQLLAHRSGIGDYVDEDDDQEVEDHFLPISVHRITNCQDYLQVLDGFPQKFSPGTRFGYCNSGYAVLAILAERASGSAFSQLVDAMVCRPAGLTATGFLRSDQLPGNAAIGYLDLDGLRNNVFHLPLVGTGDGGLYSTAKDLYRFWTALFAGRIVPTEMVHMMTAPVSAAGDHSYGLGFWLSESAVFLEGMDAGVSFRSVHDPGHALTHTVVSNTTAGAWPVSRLLCTDLLA